MSVQLSQFTARLLNMSETKPPNVRRCLFGKPDSEQLSRDSERQLQKIYEEDARRFKELWSFDPIKGPIEGGKFQYELISGSDVPSFYTKGYYTTRKSKHVRMIRDRSFNTESCRFNSAKRKLDLDEQENNENEISNKRVPNRGDIVNDSEEQNVQSSTSPVVVSSGNSSCSRLCDLPVGLSRLSTLSSLPDLSPLSRDNDIMTPPSKAKSLVQSSMKDYLANKKQRKFNTKSLSRP